MGGIIIELPENEARECKKRIKFAGALGFLAGFSAGSLLTFSVLSNYHNKQETIKKYDEIFRQEAGTNHTKHDSLRTYRAFGLDDYIYYNKNCDCFSFKQIPYSEMKKIVSERESIKLK